MNKCKILGLTFLLTFSVGVNAQQKQAEKSSQGQIVMTKEELKSFLKMVAEKRLEQLHNMETQSKQANTIKYIDVYKQPRKKKLYNRSYIKGIQNKEEYLSNQIQKVNDRLDNLMLALIGKGNSTVIATTGVNPVEPVDESSNNNTDAQILALEKKIDSLKSIKENVVEEEDNTKVYTSPQTVDKVNKEDIVEENNTKVYISPQRRSVLEGLLAKYKNFKRQVFFANNSYAVSQSDLAYIDGVVRILKQNPELSVVLVGYASTVGSAEYNKQLSMQRAESVANSITSKGISKNRVISAFYGADKNTTATKARRVDMTVVIK